MSLPARSSRDPDPHRARPTLRPTPPSRRRRTCNRGEGWALPELTIDDALVRLLDVQRSRLALRTFRRYEEICDLLRHCLNGYGHTGLSGLELKRWERAYEAGDEEVFCHLMGPEQLVDNLGEFLGYFMIRKVAADRTSRCTKAARSP